MQFLTSFQLNQKICVNFINYYTQKRFYTEIPTTFTTTLDSMLKLNNTSKFSM